jgi:hypothetical protein
MDYDTGTVQYLQLHDALFVPGEKGKGGMELKRTITQEFYPGISLQLHSLGVVCCFRGQTFIIPANQIKCIVLKG